MPLMDDPGSLRILFSRDPLAFSRREGRLVTGREDSERKVLFKKICICHKNSGSRFSSGWSKGQGMMEVGSSFDALRANGKKRNFMMIRLMQTYGIYKVMPDMPGYNKLKFNLWLSF